ncbi:MAG TPA: TetR/AcrR family transcriptional regulator [Caulobacteraceae bacterium]|nr:TetR/AcrR family transcriptional regulator [Caulobacteraceae bacterium]
MGVREQQKQATRARVMDAARDLFDHVGYEETTIRAIAEKAGVSVGSVFTTFSSKADILSQVIAERTAALTTELERVAPHLRGSLTDRLSAIMAVHYDFQMRRPKLYLAYLAASFRAEHEEGFVRMGANPGLQAPIREILQGAIARGEAPAGLDVELLIETLVALYGFNYLRVAEGATAADLTALMDRQLGLLFEGLKTRPLTAPAL